MVDEIDVAFGSRVWDAPARTPVAQYSSPLGQRTMFTARAATNSTVVAEIADSTSIIIFTRRVSGIASVGLKAIALVNETYT
jgi:hypothetical protein